ncbi:MAG TPA: hypothetical protein VH619_18895 [Verrucomicrobiae bacterium]|jgi:hypothetical protein|nr:hypothetical protein [Verrucomicrobiae bacterium]
MATPVDLKTIAELTIILEPPTQALQKIVGGNIDVEPIVRTLMHAVVDLNALETELEDLETREKNAHADIAEAGKRPMSNAQTQSIAETATKSILLASARRPHLNKEISQANHQASEELQQALEQWNSLIRGRIQKLDAYVADSLNPLFRGQNRLLNDSLKEMRIPARNSLESALFPILSRAEICNQSTQQLSGNFIKFISRHAESFEP